MNGEKDLFGDASVVLVPLPGHTPGSLGALVNLDRDGPFLLASDTMSLRQHLDTDIAPRNTWNAEALLKIVRGGQADREVRSDRDLRP